MRKIKKNDEVIVLTGRSRGRHGKVTAVLEHGSRVMVEGLNLVKKHIKANPQANISGGIVEREAPLHISNVAIYNPTSGKADRVVFKVVDGKKVRCFSSDGKVVDN